MCPRFSSGRNSSAVAEWLGRRTPCLVLSCLGDYVSVTVWYDETVVVVGLSVKLAV